MKIVFNWIKTRIINKLYTINILFYSFSDVCNRESIREGRSQSLFVIRLSDKAENLYYLEE